MIKFIFILFPFVFCSLSFAQVTDKKFDLMLQELLGHSIDQISVTEAIKKENAVFIDTREKGEYKVSHIKGAKWVGYETFLAKRLNGIPKDQEIILYCSVGYRSEKIGEKLQELGYKKVLNLYGGIFEWVNAEKPVVNNKEESTTKVHAFDKEWGRWLKKGKKVF